MGAFDTALVSAGEFGPYQKRLYSLLCLLCISTGISAVVVVLVTAEPKHRCAIPAFLNDTYHVDDDSYQSFINSSIPAAVLGKKVVYSKCKIYSFRGNRVNSSWLSLVRETNLTESTSCSVWVYDKTYFESTAVTEMNLVCDRNSLRSHLKMAFMLGKALGVVFLSVFSDLFGRKKLMVLSVILAVVGGFLSAWVTTALALCFSLAILGASNAGIYNAIFVIGMELTGPTKRYYAGTLLDFFFAFGECLVSLVGYIFRDRNITVTILIIPNALLLPFLWLAPESPRWLLQKGRRKEAVVIMNKLAEINGTTIDEKTMDSLNEEHDQQESIVLVLKSWRYTWRFVLIFINWFAVSLMFYGLSLHSMDTVGNPYLNLFLFSLVEFPAYLIDLVLLKFFGRRIVMCLSMCFGGLACISTLFPLLYGDSSTESAILALELIGKLGAAMAFTTLYTFTSELIPTTVRSRGIGASATFARIGGVVAPYIAHMEDNLKGPIGVALPMLVYGGLSIFAGLLNILLPETKNKPMPDKIADLKTTLRPRRSHRRTAGDSTETLYALGIEAFKPYLCGTLDFIVTRDPGSHH